MSSRRQQYLLYATLFGSALQQAQAHAVIISTGFQKEQGRVGSSKRDGLALPACVQSCLRQAGCSTLETSCICKEATAGLVSGTAECMSQTCEKDVDLNAALGPFCTLSSSSNTDTADSSNVNTKVTSESNSGSNSDSSASKASSSQSVRETFAVGVPPTAAAEPQATATEDLGLLTGSAAPSGSDTGLIVATGSPTTPGAGSESLVIATATATAGASTIGGSTKASSSGGASATSSAATSSSTSSSTKSGSSSSPSSTDDSQSVDPDSGAAADGRASLLGAVLAVSAALVFGW